MMKIKIDRDSSRHFGTIFGMVLLLIICLFIIFASGCTTLKKVNKYTQKHPAKGVALAVKIFDNQDSTTFGRNDSLAATYASKRYPCKDSVHTLVKYLPGKPVLVPGEKEFVFVDCDSLIKATGKAGKIKVPVPVYLQVDTSAIVSEIYQTDKAKYNALQAQFTSAIVSKDQVIEKQKQQLKSATENAIKYKKYFLWSLLVLAVVILLSLILRKIGL